VTDDDRATLVLDARALLKRAVDVVADAKAKGKRSRELVAKSKAQMVWSDYLIGESRQLADRLHNAVAMVAVNERLNGAPPERVLALLKGLVADARADKLDANDARSLIEDVVRWAIEGYNAA
jgi:hypothetical protein